MWNISWFYNLLEEEKILHNIFYVATFQYYIYDFLFKFPQNTWKLFAIVENFDGHTLIELIFIIQYWSENYIKACERSCGMLFQCEKKTYLSYSSLTVFRFVVYKNKCFSVKVITNFKIIYDVIGRLPTLCV